VKMLLLAIMLSLNLTACRTMGSGEIDISTKTACATFRSINWSKKDTRLTQAQIVEHNAVYKEYCK
jgi:hypothetical protein